MNSVRRKYRFLFISMPFGGIEVFLKNLHDRVGMHDDIEATWLWIDWRNEDPYMLKPLARWNWTLHGSLLARSTIRRHLRSGVKFDAMFFNHVIPAMALGRLRKTAPLVLSMDITPGVFRMYREVERISMLSDLPMVTALRDKILNGVLENASAILPWSDLVARSLRDEHGVPNEKLMVVRPGIDLALWGRPASIAGAERHDSFDVLFVGGDFFRKGGDTLLEVANSPEARSWHFHVVSRSAPDQVGSNVTVYRDLAANSEPLRQLYHRASVLVLPTRADIAPNAISEAMAAGLPVISTTVGAIPEMVRDGKTGFLIPPGDANSLRDRLLQLASDPALGRSFGAAALQVAKQEYDLNDCVARILDQMRKAADRTGRNP